MMPPTLQGRFFMWMEGSGDSSMSRNLYNIIVFKRYPMVIGLAINVKKRNVGIDN
jgi:hypothetical protein